MLFHLILTLIWNQHNVDSLVAPALQGHSQHQAHVVVMKLKNTNLILEVIGLHHLHLYLEQHHVHHQDKLPHQLQSCSDLQLQEDRGDCCGEI